MDTDTDGSRRDGVVRGRFECVQSLKKTMQGKKSRLCTSRRMYYGSAVKLPGAD
jgi:hypothetical protein